MTDDASDRLTRHLQAWVGEWPPPAPGVNVVGDPARLEPTWDGVVRPLLGVGDGVGTVIAVPPGFGERGVGGAVRWIDDPGAGRPTR